jgi:hypothetical protein
MLQLYDISNTFFDELNVDRKVKEGLLEKHYYKYLYPYHITRILENKKLAYSEKCKWINEFLDINYISYLEKDTGMFSRLLKRREYRKLIWYCKLLKLVK